MRVSNEAMTTIFTVAGWVAGFWVGLLTTKTYYKQKYAEQAEEEIRSVKEAFENWQNTCCCGGKCAKEESKIIEKWANIPNVPLIDDVFESIRQKYAGEETGKTPSEDRPILGREGPYVIPPEEFGELYDYEQISLTLYADGVLADDSDYIVDDIEEIVGRDSLTHFGEYEEDSVFVRNDAKRCDYEILRDLRKYSDVLKDKPYLRRGNE